VICCDNSEEILPAVVDDSPSDLTTNEGRECVRVSEHVIGIEHVQQSETILKIIAFFAEKHPEQCTERSEVQLKLVIIGGRRPGIPFA
jgi:hypothetical protein